MVMQNYTGNMERLLKEMSGKKADYQYHKNPILILKNMYVIYVYMHTNT